MGRLGLLGKLTVRGLRRHVVESVLLAAALVVAAASLVLGLALHGRTAAPYAHTRTATRGPDVVAAVLPQPRTSVTTGQRERLAALVHDPAVIRSSGPFPTTWATLRTGRFHGAAEVQGRDPRAAAVDQPRVTAGTWIRPDRAVLERAFADALEAHVGTVVDIGGRTFRVTGIAATAAATPYPSVCFLGCTLATPTLAAAEPGLVWLTRADAQALATRTEPVALFANLALRPGADADAFVAAHGSAAPAAPLLTSWHQIADHDEKVVRNERVVLVFGGSLLSLLAMATVTVLVSGRMSREMQRAGTLKAVGARPAFVAATLLGEYLAVAVVATAVGVVLARLVAPHLDVPSAGLLAAPSAPPITSATVAAVTGVLLGLTGLATIGAALRLAGTDTISAVVDAARRPRRTRALISVSSRLPVAGLLGLRVVARRPRRSLLAAGGIAVAVCGIVVALLAGTRLGAEHAALAGAAPDPDSARLDHVMFAVTVMITVLSLVNVVFVASTTAAEARTMLAVAQALGASPTAKLSAVAVALAVPALLGAVIGLPAGIGLFGVLNHSDTATGAPVLALVAVVPATTVLAAALAAAATRLAAARVPLGQVLQAG